jgi:hypothetical protein
MIDHLITTAILTAIIGFLTIGAVFPLHLMAVCGAAIVIFLWTGLYLAVLDFVRHGAADDLSPSPEKHTGE